MKKTLLCNVKMGDDAIRIKYRNEDSSLQVSKTAVRYPINALLEESLNPEDVLNVVLIAKNNNTGRLEKNVDLCIEEFKTVEENTGAKFNYQIITTEFDENIEVHNKLFLDIIDSIEENTEIIVDMTYGPKDQVLILFAAINFAEQNYGCKIQNIMYGKITFSENEPQDAQICEMSPLYYLNVLTNTIECNSAEEARKMIETVMNM